MLDFLVTSKVRRRILRLLFADGASGSTAEFAERARIGYASAYRELRLLESVGLVSAGRAGGAGGAEVFAANGAHPLAGAIRALASASMASLPDPSSRRADDHTRNQLFSLGAPTFGKSVTVEDVESAVVRAVELSHRDATVASVLPVVFYKLRDRLSPERLVHHARQLAEKRALGFYLDLTTDLCGDPRFVRWSMALRDRRWSALEYLFVEDRRSPLTRELAERNTPAAARRWGLRANMGLDAFESMFARHAHA